MYKNLLDKIKEYKNITIFRHMRPDGDCVFSAFALKEFILTNFKDKKVKCVGKDIYDVFPINDIASNNFIKNSLAIIVDVSNEDRIDDKRFNDAKECIIIDHHPHLILPNKVSTFYFDTEAAACCEFITRILFSKTFKDYTISDKCCEYLLSGIITDSNSFKTASTSANTLKYASLLIKKANLNISDINYFVFSKNKNIFIKNNKIKNKLIIKDRIAYVILNKKDINKIGITTSQAKNTVDDFSVIKDIDIWAVFAYNDESKLYDGSIRSRRGFVINELANKYNGGGHKTAVGVKRLSPKMIKNLLSDLEKIKKVSNQKA